MQPFTPREPTTEELLATLGLQKVSLPFSEEAEKGVISCLLQDPDDRIPEIKSLVPAAAFYHVKYRTVYKALLEMWEAGVPIGIGTLVMRLRDQGSLDKIGGPSELSEMWTFIAVQQHYPFYLRALQDKHNLRKLLRADAQNMMDAINHGRQHIDETPEALLNTAEERVRSVRDGTHAGEFKTTADWMTELADDIDAQVTRNREMVLEGEVAIAGVSTGMSALDERTNGFCQGHVWLVQASHSDGKTAFAIQCELSLAMSGEGIPCVHYLMEGSAKDFWKRCLSHLTRIDLNRILSGDLTAEEIDLLGMTMNHLRTAPFHLRHKPGMTKREILTDMRLMHRKHAKISDTKPHMLFSVDYLQRVKGRDKFQEEHEHIKTTSAEITDLTGTLKSCTLLLAQLAEDGKTAGSKAVSCDTDVTLTISCPPAVDEHGKPYTKQGKYGDVVITKKDESKRVLTFGKNRVGKRGGLPITTEFRGEIQRFS